MHGSLSIPPKLFMDLISQIKHLSFDIITMSTFAYDHLQYNYILNIQHPIGLAA